MFYVFKYNSFLSSSGGGVREPIGAQEEVAVGPLHNSQKFSSRGAGSPACLPVGMV